MIIIGIDPGASGGIAQLKQQGASWRPSAIPMPETEKDIADHLWGFYLAAQKDEIEIICFLEHIQPMPIIKRHKTPSGEIREEVNPGLNQIGNFMKHYGFLRGCLITIGIELEDIRPQKWQKLLGCMTRGNKNISKQKAMQLFPQLRITHGTADSLCIAEAGRQIRMGLSARPLFDRSMNPKDMPAPWAKVRSVPF